MRLTGGCSRSRRVRSSSRQDSRSTQGRHTGQRMALTAQRTTHAVSAGQLCASDRRRSAHVSQFAVRCSLYVLWQIPNCSPRPFCTALRLAPRLRPGRAFPGCDGHVRFLLRLSRQERSPEGRRQSRVSYHRCHNEAKRGQTASKPESQPDKRGSAFAGKCGDAGTHQSGKRCGAMSVTFSGQPKRSYNLTKL